MPISLVYYIKMRLLSCFISVTPDAVSLFNPSVFLFNLKPEPDNKYNKIMTTKSRTQWYCKNYLGSKNCN